MVWSPFTGWWTKRKPSAVSQMSAPEPSMVKVPEFAEAVPATPTDPTSCAVHGVGRVVELLMLTTTSRLPVWPAVSVTTMRRVWEPLP